ncbi:MAG: hypothetical protein NC310_03470 [Roseburia sp.]|nr:hypothetical protein [Anaeroplasma bactoclasticum]MCM1196119.1 hypothetical protein [Roseburia sp.]MCM1555999.1 hypothetical protein [Anaeroplasma bactoclasticum]
MQFKFYYLKEGTRVFDRTELLTYFQSNPNVTLEKNGDNRDYTFHHPILDFDAHFILSAKSAIPHLERLNPKYFDVNFRVEFDIKLPTYCVELILDIADEIAKMFKFAVYNESYENVVAFRKNTLAKTFDIWKNAYKNKNEEEIASFSRIDSASLSQIYNYILRKPKLEVLLDGNKVQISDYFFMRADKSRTAFVCMSWDGENPFIIPPGIDILYYKDSKAPKYVAMQELVLKADKLLKIIDGYGNIRMVDGKAIGKLRKIITKSKFAPLTVELKEIKLKNILDI